MGRRMGKSLPSGAMVKAVNRTWMPEWPATGDTGVGVDMERVIPRLLNVRQPRTYTRIVAHATHD